MPNQNEQPQTRTVYRCDVCGYIYDPLVGIPAEDIVPGTKFADLPTDWVCPICGARKEKFSAREHLA